MAARGKTDKEHLIFKKTNFMGKDVLFNESKAVIVPVPFASTTHSLNTINAPKAILHNWNMEDYDLQLGYAPCSKGIYPLPERAYEGEEGFQLIEIVAEELFRTEKFPVFLGGDQTVAIATTNAAKKVYDDLTVIIFDAHSDLKDSFQGSKYSHMCVARRIGENMKTVQIGVRSIGTEELEIAKKKDAFERISKKELEAVLRKSGKNVYISIDVAVFDPSIMPATEMPEQNGLTWKEVTDILEKIAKKKNIVGCDICELSPIKGLDVPQTLCAQLAYKIIGFKFLNEMEEE